jgi:hypothetical protein
MFSTSEFQEKHPGAAPEHPDRQACDTNLIRGVPYIASFASHNAQQHTATMKNLHMALQIRPKKPVALLPDAMQDKLHLDLIL